MEEKEWIKKGMEFWEKKDYEHAVEHQGLVPISLSMQIADFLKVNIKIEAI